MKLDISEIFGAIFFGLLNLAFIFGWILPLIVGLRRLRVGKNGKSLVIVACVWAALIIAIFVVARYSIG